MNCDDLNQRVEKIEEKFAKIVEQLVLVDKRLTALETAPGTSEDYFQNLQKIEGQNQ